MYYLHSRKMNHNTIPKILTPAHLAPSNLWWQIFVAHFEFPPAQEPNTSYQALTTYHANLNLFSEKKVRHLWHAYPISTRSQAEHGTQDSQMSIRQRGLYLLRIQRISQGEWHLSWTNPSPQPTTKWDCWTEKPVLARHGPVHYHQQRTSSISLGKSYCHCCMLT